MNPSRLRNQDDKIRNAARVKTAIKQKFPQTNFLFSFQHVIRGNRPIKAEMAHQLYVLQVLTFNLLEERMMTKMDPNDQVKMKMSAFCLYLMKRNDLKIQESCGQIFFPEYIKHRLHFGCACVLTEIITGLKYCTS